VFEAKQLEYDRDNKNYKIHQSSIDYYGLFLSIYTVVLRSSGPLLKIVALRLLTKVSKILQSISLKDMKSYLEMTTVLDQLNDFLT
jgi:hypothetical protein